MFNVWVPRGLRKAMIIYNNWNHNYVLLSGFNTERVKSDMTVTHTRTHNC